MTIILLCGRVGVGKSTLAQRLGERLKAQVISSDSFKRRIYERLLLEVERNVDRREYLILDATFYKKIYRDRVREIVGGGERIITVHLKCPLEVSLERNRRRKDPVPERGIRIISSLFEEPENPDIVINTAEVGVDEAVERVLKTMQTQTE